MRKDAWNLGTWGRIPVSMHWTVLLALAWLWLFTWNPVGWIVAAACFFALLVAHEFGHVFMLRRRRIPVMAITLYGLHGETHYDEYSAKAADVTAVAWGGVGAQALILVAALAFQFTVNLSAAPWLAVVAGPMLLVFTFINVFLMILALLPIGPFDGHAAWQVIPRMRARMKRKAPARPKPAAPPPQPPEARITEEQQRELDRAAEKETAELMAKLTGKSGANTGDR
jgi:Zn-dependent protease